MIEKAGLCLSMERPYIGDQMHLFMTAMEKDKERILDEEETFYMTKA